ncbi:DUF3558 family protein [Pseudonocardia nematodicida]|uniref:DUF3558 family protein n=1 Tax=Pseudonocardia nematodicida TaxID=1206997 RepID=A0ABV1KCK3_9PSEU
MLEIALGVSLVAGCGAAPDAEGASPFPPRPATIDLRGVDVCELVDDEDLVERDLEPGTATVADVGGIPSPTCAWIATDGRASYSVQNIGQPASIALGGPTSEVARVAGFGAVLDAPEVNNGPGFPAFCQVAVDLNDDQTLRIQVSNGDPRTGGDQAELDRVCTEASTFAALIVDGLPAQR